MLQHNPGCVHVCQHNVIMNSNKLYINVISIRHGCVKSKTVRLRAQTHFIIGVFWERRAGEMTFCRGAERRIHHLRPVSILVTRPVPELEESCSKAASLASQHYNFGIKDNNV